MAGAEGADRFAVTPGHETGEMAKQRQVFVCRECGSESVSWAGQCPQCNGWATIEEAAVPQARVARGADSPVRSLQEFDAAGAVPVPTGIDEIDRVLGGGLVPASVSLLGGEPGIGKSTLTLQMAMSVGASGGSVILVTGEEAPSQVAARAGRLGPIPESLSVVDATDVDVICAAIETERPQLAVVDSIQTLQCPEIDSAPGSVTQVRAGAHRLVEVAKKTGASVVLIGHVTKDGNLAGPRLLEHVVDTVLSFTGDRHHDLRFLRTAKHRFGPTAEVGVFEMAATGLEAVVDPSVRFLADRQAGAPGSVVVATIDNQRPVLVEVQALATAHGDRPPRLNSQGLVASRVELVSAVLRRRGGIDLWGWEVFTSAAGGAEVREPGGDLGLAVAIASGLLNRAVGPETVVVGEVGLAGEIRSVAQLERRLQESFRLGFRRAIVPNSAPEGPTGLKLVRVGSLSEALGVLDLQVETHDSQAA